VLSLVNGDRQFAEDVVQETMLRAWLHSDELVAEHAAPWLYTVAHRVAVSLYHRRRRARPEEVPLADAPLQVTNDSAARVDDALELRAAMDRLGPEHRDVLVQLHYLQRPVAQVAEALGIPAGTVRSRAFYALRELRAILEEQGVAGP
jgi:RNA polymerase sigma-70 factor (ECF subfamily)